MSNGIVIVLHIYWNVKYYILHGKWDWPILCDPWIKRDPSILCDPSILILNPNYTESGFSGGASVLDQGRQTNFNRAPNSVLTALTMWQSKLNEIFKFTIVTLKLTNWYDIGTCNSYYNKNVDVYFITQLCYETFYYYYSIKCYFFF